MIQWWHRLVNRKGRRQRCGHAVAVRRKLSDRLLVEGLEERWAPTAQSFTGPISADFNPSVFGQTVNLSVSVTGDGTIPSTPTGAVDFMDGLSDLGMASLDSSGNATLPVTSFTVGSHTIVATYSGDSNFSGSSSGPMTQTVNQASSVTALTASGSPTSFGQPVTLTATVSPVSPSAGVPTGSVSFMDGSSSLGSATLDNSGSTSLTTSALGVGDHTISAIYNGDGDFTGSTSGSVPQTVNQAASATVVTASSNPATFGQAITYTATVTAVAPGAGIPTGTISFMDGATTLGTAGLDNTGAASLTTSALSTGDHTITAVYSGDSNFSGSTSDAVIQTISQAAAVTAVSVDINATVYGQPASFTVTVSASDPNAGIPSGSITLMDGSSPLATASLDSNGTTAFSISSLSVGNHSVTAVYAGDNNFIGSTSAALTQTVSQAATSTVVSASSSSVPAGQAVILTAAVNVTAPGSGIPSGTITFMDGSNVLGSADLSNGSASLTTTLSLGNRVIQAIYAGDSSFIGSTSSNVSVADGTANERFVDQAYQALLGRPADANGLATWSGSLDQGATRTQVSRAIESGPEYLSDVVQNLYTALLGRSADPVGLSFFTNLLATGGTIEQAKALIIGSPEYFQKNGGTNDGFLNGVYDDVLNRAIDPEGQATFSALLANGGSTGDVARLVLNSTEAQQDLIQAYYQQYLHRAADDAGLNDFLSTLQSGARDQDIAAAVLGSDEFFSHV